MATTTLIPLHAGKGRTVATALGLSVDYVENPGKTEYGAWVTAYECDPISVDSEFMFSKRQYAAITGRNQGERDVIAYHLRISFKPGETDAATANKIGYDLAMKLTHGNHAFVCCTHVDKAHIHTHVVFNSTTICNAKKFRNFKRSSFAVRRIADHLCVENGLSIITNPKPSRGNYAKWRGDTKPPTNREKLERMIDAALENCNNRDAFIAAMIAAGCEVKEGKNLAFKIPCAERFLRCKSLGADYTDDAILERLRGLRKITSAVFVPFRITGQTKFSLLIDIQQKVQEGKGEAYENWARCYNLKQAARTLIFLRDSGIDSYDNLLKKSSAASGEFNRKLIRVKEIDARLSEITELQKQIGNYRKTRENYKAWIKSGRSDSFYEAFRADIILHQTAKRHFDSLGLKKFPPIDSLKQELAMLAAEKKTLYRGYHELKDRRLDLLRAKDNVQRLLGINKDEPERIDPQTQNRNYSHEI